jgi:hypothetical protein
MTLRNSMTVRNLIDAVSRPRAGKCSVEPFPSSYSDLLNMGRRGHKSTKVGLAWLVFLFPSLCTFNQIPNVKLRPPMPGTSQSSVPSSSYWVQDTQVDVDSSLYDLCPRPFQGVVVCATGVPDKVCVVLLSAPLSLTVRSNCYLNKHLNSGPVLLPHSRIRSLILSQRTMVELNTWLVWNLSFRFRPFDPYLTRISAQ